MAKNLNLDNFFDDFEVKYRQCFITIEGTYYIFSTNFRPKTKTVVRAVFEKNISVWFWANLEAFSRISPDQDFFSKMWLCHFSAFIVPWLHAKNQKTVSEKKLFPLPTSQPTNQPIITNSTDLNVAFW